MTQPELLDLDALEPRTQRVRVGNDEYAVPVREGLPVAALLAGARLASLEGAAQIEAVVAFLAQYTPIPREKLDRLSMKQLESLFACIIPAPEVAASADPQKPAATAQGVDGATLRALAGMPNPSVPRL